MCIRDSLGIVKPRKTKSAEAEQRVRAAQASLMNDVEGDDLHAAALDRLWVDNLEQWFTTDALHRRVKTMHQDDINRLVVVLRSALAFFHEDK